MAFQHQNQNSIHGVFSLNFPQMPHILPLVPWGAHLPETPAVLWQFLRAENLRLPQPPGPF